MLSNNKKNLLYAAAFGILLASLGGMSGCILAVDPDLEGPLVVDGSPYIADLEVNWNIDRSTAASLCTTYGIDHWILQVSGPEFRKVDIDCRENFWSSENDLLSLTEGSYRITLQAVDYRNRLLTEVAVSYQLQDRGYINRLDIDLHGQDFSL